MRHALTSPDYFGGVDMMGADSWAGWRSILLAIVGEPLTPAELDIFRTITDRDTSPTEPVREFWGVVGRRGGKSRAMGTLAAYLAAASITEACWRQGSVDAFRLLPHRRTRPTRSSTTSSARSSIPRATASDREAERSHAVAHIQDRHSGSGAVVPQPARRDEHRGHCGRDCVLAFGREREPGCGDHRGAATITGDHEGPADRHLVALRQARGSLGRLRQGLRAGGAARAAS